MIQDSDKSSSFSLQDCKLLCGNDDDRVVSLVFFLIRISFKGIPKWPVRPMWWLPAIVTVAVFLCNILSFASVGAKCLISQINTGKPSLMLVSKQSKNQSCHFDSFKFTDLSVRRIKSPGYPVTEDIFCMFWLNRILVWEDFNTVSMCSEVLFFGG